MLAMVTGKMPPAWHPMYIGANACGPCNNHYYTGLMDSVRVFRVRIITQPNIASCLSRSQWFNYDSQNTVSIHTI